MHFYRLTDRLDAIGICCTGILDDISYAEGGMLILLSYLV